MEMPRNKAELLRILEGLSQGHRAKKSNPGSYQCEACEGCTDCQFCRDSYHCQSSSYLTGCTRCLASTHCSHCEDLVKCSQSVESKRCTNSAYLIYSEDCHNCTYCFGCVGLHQKDFHIFNQAYGRTEYFNKVATLKKTLGLP